MHKEIKTKKQGYCLICFKSLFENVSLHTLIFPNHLICEECKNKFKRINHIDYINGVKVTFLYEYNQFMKDLIYQYKGCYDIVLKDVFLSEFKNKIKRKYKNYIVIFPPSNKNEDTKRGFNHIEKIIECLKLKNDYLFIKEKEVKQSSQLYKNRKNIEKIIKLKSNKIIDTNKSYLIIDDIYTSGATLKTLINILLSKGVKKEQINAIIIAKTADFVEL